MSGKPLKLRIYREDLGLLPFDHNQGNPNDEIPTDVIIRCLDADKIKYLHLIGEAKKRFERDLKSEVNAIINWHHESDDEMCLTRSGKGSASITDWRLQGEIALQNLFSEIKIKRRECLKDPSTWKDICMEVKHIRKENTSTAIIEETENNVLVVVGSEVNVKKVYPEVEKMCVELEQKLEHNCIELRSPLHKAVFRKTKIESEWKVNHPKLTFDIMDDRIRFRGPMKSLIDAQTILANFFQQVIERKIELSDGGSHVLKMVRKQDKGNVIDGFVETSEVVLQVDDEVATVVGVRKDAEELEDMIKHIYQECTFELTEDEQAGFRDGNFQEFINEQSRKCKGILLLELHDNNSKINLAALSEQFEEIRKGVDVWIKKHTIYSRYMRLDLEVLRLINHGMKDELRKIIKELSQHKIKIEPRMDDITGFQFSGTEEGLRQAQNRVKKLIDKLITEDHTVSSPGMAYYFKSHKDGIFRIKSWQEKYNVIIHPVKTKSGKKGTLIQVENKSKIKITQKVPPSSKATATLRKGRNKMSMMQYIINRSNSLFVKFASFIF